VWHSDAASVYPDEVDFLRSCRSDVRVVQGVWAADAVSSFSPGRAVCKPCRAEREQWRQRCEADVAAGVEEERERHEAWKLRRLAQHARENERRRRLGVPELPEPYLEPDWLERLRERAGLKGSPAGLFRRLWRKSERPGTVEARAHRECATAGRTRLGKGLHRSLATIARKEARAAASLALGRPF
jgi:hypothetical protein